MRECLYSASVNTVEGNHSRRPEGLPAALVDSLVNKTQFADYGF